MGDGADGVNATGGERTAARPSVRAVFRFGGLVLCGWLVIYILPLGQRPLIMPDETRYAEIPREMLSTGDWVVPRLAGLRYFEKPPLGYWVNTTSISLLGEHEFAVRLPSAVAAGLTALLVFGFARTVSRCAKTGIFAAAVYLTFVEVYLVGTFNVLDNLLTLFLTAAIIAFHRAVVSRDARFALLAGMAAGGAFLTKGFLGFAIPALVLTPWLLWERRFLRSLPHAFLAVLAAIAISAPWAVLIHLQEGDFWSYFFWEEHIRRFLGEDAQHPEPLLYFVVLLPLLAFPWLCLFPAAFSGQRTRLSSSRRRSEWRLIWTWAVLPFVFFSLSRGKLMTYILPCFPALAVFVAAGVSSYLASGKRRLVLGGILANSAIVLLVIAGLAAIGAGLWAPGLWTPDEPRLALFALALGLGAGAGLHACRSCRPQSLLAGSVLMIAPMLLAAPFSMPSKVLAHKAPGGLLEAFAERIGESTIVISDSTMVRAVAWYFKRSDVYLTSSGELAYGLGYPDGAHRLLDEGALRASIDGNAGNGALAMVCKRRCPSWALDVLSGRADQHRAGRFVMWYLPDERSVSGAGAP